MAAGEANSWLKTSACARARRMGLPLTLSSHCAIIAGRAVWNGQPAPGARIVVLLRGTPENPGDSWSGFTDPEGGFELSDIAAGSYVIWAWQDDDSGLSAGPPDLGSVST